MADSMIADLVIADPVINGLPIGIIAATQAGIVPPNMTMAPAGPSGGCARFSRFVPCCSAWP